MPRLLANRVRRTLPCLSRRDPTASRQSCTIRDSLVAEDVAVADMVTAAAGVMDSEDADAANSEATVVVAAGVAGAAAGPTAMAMAMALPVRPLLETSKLVRVEMGGSAVWRGGGASL